MSPFLNLIGGELVGAASGETVWSIEPATGAKLAEVPAGGAEDAMHAVDAAAEAFPMWRATPATERARLCSLLADRLSARREELGLLESRDTGSCLGPMTADVDKAVATFRYFAGLATELKGVSVPASQRGLHVTLREPFGVVVGIAAFNHPLMFAAAKLAAPLIAGNTVVVKPPPQAPLSSLVLGEIAAEIFPPGVVNIVTGPGNEVGVALVADERVRRISVTGSVATGKAVMAAAANHLAEVSLELGGKNPLIIFPDADLAQAVVAAADSMNFGWQGQSCGSTSRVLVHRDVLEEFCTALADHVGRLRVGSPIDPATQVGAIVSRAQYDRVLDYIEIGKREGATVLVGGSPIDVDGAPEGLFIAPTVFIDVTPSMRIAREEIFGPVMAVLSWVDEDEAIQMANDSEFALTANIFTDSLEVALRVVPRLEAGFVWVNGRGEHFRGLPYGGQKQSGIGTEESLEQLLSYTQNKSVSLLSL